MSSRCRSVVAVAIALLAGAAFAADRRHAVSPLRVCADPHAMPFSNARREGFENAIADVVARDLGRRVEYVWWAQRRGFFRNTLGAGLCDVVIGVPSGFERAATTRPYYRSSYVFVSRADRALALRSLDDPRLRDLRVGVTLIGNDATNSPPAHALARRGIVTNVVGFPVYGGADEDTPSPRIVEAVERREVDVAIVWGPVAGYLARRATAPLAIAAVEATGADRPLAFAFDIAIGVRRNDERLRAALDGAIARRAADIDAILDRYGVPRVGAS